MRVAMLSYHTCPLAVLGGKDTGGMNVYVRELTRQLGRIGVHVDVFTRSQDEHVPHVLHDLGFGNRVVHVPAGPEVPLPKEELTDYIDQFVGGIRDFAASKGLTYDLIHSHYWMSGLAAEALKAEWHIPMIQMFHTLGVMKQRVARSSEELEGEYRLNGERRVLRVADRIVAATQAEFAQLQWLYQADTRKIVVIPPGVDLSRFYPIPADEAKEAIGVDTCNRMLLFVGRIEPLKGIDTLIQAIALMRQNGTLGEEVCLALIGGETDVSPQNVSQEMARLQEMRQQYDLGNFVTFLGQRSQETLPYYYSAAEAVVVPSVYESFGMVALEAMACGTPVVASEVGGLAFLVQDHKTGFTVPFGEPQALAEKLADLLQDENMRRSMGAQAATFARDYSWEKITNRVKSLYDEVLEVSARSGEPPVNLQMPVH
jgi:D-inositol-3-phosphate glycosyltransferase